MTAKLIIGLTGGIGSGKTAASDHFAKQGVDIVDADVIARLVVQPGKPALQKIANTFGQSILLDNGELDRAKLRQRVFSKDESGEKDKQSLNDIMQPAIRTELLIQLNNAQSDYVILSAPLLLENNLDNLCHRVLVVDVPESVQVSRATQRDNVSNEQINAILKSQISRTERLQRASDIIDNTKDLSFLYSQVIKLHNKYLTLANG